MLLKDRFDIKKISTITTLLLALVVIFGAMLTEFFQAPKSNIADLNQFRLLFDNDAFLDTTKITLKNRIGRISLIRQSQSERWLLTEPTNLPGNSETISRIIQMLHLIKVRETHSNDAINLTNYALNSPAIEIELTNDSAEVTKLSFGLVNPIDNSTYLLESTNQIIYQIDNILPFFERIVLSDMIDVHPLPFTLSELRSVKFYRGEKRGDNPRYQVFRDEAGDLFTKPNVPLKDIKITDGIKAIFSIQSQKILEATEVPKSLEQQLRGTYLTIELELITNESTIYKISYLLNDIPELKMDKGSTFVITNSKTGHTYLIHKDQFKIFNFIP